MIVRPPTRALHRYTQRLAAPPGTVFPLLCPVRERDWTPGWDPRLVLSESGVAEDGCVFTTDDSGTEAIWVVTAYEPPTRIAFVKVTPGEMVTRILIDLEPDGTHRTRAHVTYEYTALGEAAEETVRSRTGDWYAAFMREWEAALNCWLEHGTRIEPGPPGSG